ncbi:MAG: putative peptidoglycan glycosyltransferase FtsW [Pseudomonadota bacterium]
MTDYAAPPAGLPDRSVFDNWWRTVDKLTLAALVLLLLVGLLISFAASPPLAAKHEAWTFKYVVRHAVYAGMALGGLLVLSLWSPDQVRRNGVRIFLLFLVLLLILPVVGTSLGKGAVRWISLGVITIQPVEFLKPAFIVTAAWMMAASREINGPPGVLMSLMLSVGIAVVLALQPDFGQAMLILASWGVMFFVWGASIFLIIALGAMVVGGLWFAYHNSEHVARRLDEYWSTELDPTTQLGYATNAVLNGGLFGVGAGEGEVKWSLPDAHTDFVIAVAAEEYGLLLCLGIIGVFLLITLRAFQRLMRERDLFVRLTGAGLATAFGLQAFINIGVTLRLLPAKGMTLPFISYGGSSMLAIALGMGMLLALTRKRPQDHVTDMIGGHR